MKEFSKGTRCLLVILSVLTGQVVAQTPAPKPGAAPAPAAPAKPPGPVPLGTLMKLFREADAAYAAKDYKTSAAKLEELVKVDTDKTHPLENCRFSIGLSYFMDKQYEKAITAFTDCSRLYPNGDFLSRCYLGIGKSHVESNAPGEAIPFLEKAAKDPTLRTEAGFALGKAYADDNKYDKALNVFRTLMGNDVRDPEQTSAAVFATSVLADMNKPEELIAYLRKLRIQPGIRDAIAWVSTQLVVRGDDLLGNENYEEALTLFRFVPPRAFILDQQRKAIDEKKALLKELTERAAANAKAGWGHQVGPPVDPGKLEKLSGFIDATDKAFQLVDGKPDYDASVLIRRGRALFHLERFNEALFCFSYIRQNYPKASDYKAACYAEIVTLAAKLKETKKCLEPARAFASKFPDDQRIETIYGLIGDCLISGDKPDWMAISKHYEDCCTKFPTSESRDKYLFLQGFARFQVANPEDIVAARETFKKLLTDFPTSEKAASARYYIAMSWFLSGKYKESVEACEDYLDHHPNGPHAGDMRYRLCYMMFSDRKDDQADRIIKILSDHLQTHPDDAAAGSMYCLLGDTYNQKKKDPEKAVDAFIHATKTKPPEGVNQKAYDDVWGYALDQATNVLRDNKDWKGISDLNGDFIKDHPYSDLVLKCTGEIAKMMKRQNDIPGAIAKLGEVLKVKISNPDCEEVEPLIDQIVTMMVPHKKPSLIDADAVEKDVEEALKGIIGEKTNSTTNARLYYARARVNEFLHRNTKAALYLKGLSETTDPAALSATLLSSCGTILLKAGDLERATAFAARLSQKYGDTFSGDMGPVLLGQVALAQKKFPEALQLFTDALEKNTGTSRFKEATLGKLQALSGLGQLDDAEKLGNDIITDRGMRGEPCGWAYISLGEVLEKRGDANPGAGALDLYAKADGYFQRAYIAYKTNIDIAAQACLRGANLMKKLGKINDAKERWKILTTDPRFNNTPERAEAEKALEQNP